jgi:hypothetical protein
MHVRISTRRRGDNVYQYAQLVKSYRRPDGMPAHKVIASLGKMSPLEIENIKAAIAASREGVALVLPKQAMDRVHGRKVKRNLAYLGIGVAYRLWQGWC